MNSDESKKKHQLTNGKFEGCLDCPNQSTSQWKHESDK